MKDTRIEQKVKENPHAEGEYGFYVYCIAETDSAEKMLADKLPEAIEESSSLGLVKTKQLSAIVSEVPLAVYGEETLTSHLTDAAWTAVRAMRHEKVVEYFARRSSLVPLRFGTIYLERSSIERMLIEQQDTLCEIIKRLKDREEWGVNVHCNQATLMSNIASLSARLRELLEQAQQASPGQSYLMQKKVESLRRDESRSETTRILTEIENTLRECADDFRRLRVLKVESTEYGELKAKFAFLIERSRFDDFRSAAEQLARGHEAAGFRLELTGPWPPYNFTEGSPAAEGSDTR